MICSVSIGQSAEFKNIELKVNELINKSQWDELLVTAPELITAEPAKADGYYYAAMAFFKLSDNAKASEYLAVAETLADEPMKKKIAALKTDIQTGVKTDELSKTITEKSNGKNTAEDFRKLWEIDKTKIEYALNAIELYVEKENYAEALVILSDPAIASDAQAKTIAAKLNQKPKMVALNGYNKAMKEGGESFGKDDFETAIKRFNEALAIYPKDTKAASYKRKAQEELAWQITQKTNTLDSYKDYLSKYPLGTHKGEADGTLQRSYLKFARDFAKSNDFTEAEKYYKLYQNSYANGPNIKEVYKELSDLYIAEAKKSEKVKTGYGMTRAIQLNESANLYQPNRVSKQHLEKLKKNEKKWGREDIDFIGWHADENNMIGMMMGKLNNKKVGMYFSGRTGNDMFKTPAYWKTNDLNSLDESSDKNKKYNNAHYNQDIFATLGISKKIIYPLWIYAGAGVASRTHLKEFRHNETGKLEYVKNTDGSFLVFNPEIGLQVKLAFLTLRYGINKPITPLFKEDFIQQFGVGIKF